MAQITVSNQFSLNLKDALNGLIIAVGTPVLATIEQSLEAGSLTFNWKLIGITALSATVVYLTKNYFTPTKTIISNQTESEKPVSNGANLIQPQVQSQPKQ
jgi:hypothetical protein